MIKNVDALCGKRIKYVTIDNGLIFTFEDESRYVICVEKPGLVRVRLHGDGKVLHDQSIGAVTFGHFIKGRIRKGTIEFPLMIVTNRGGPIIVVTFEMPEDQRQKIFVKKYTKEQDSVYDSELLLGKTINKIERIGDDALRIKFDDGSSVGLVVSGDCCSKSFIQHFMGVQNILGQKINKVRHIPLGAMSEWEVTRPNGEQCDFVQKYSFEIITNGGVGSIEFRNDSNGYYGGEISICPDFKLKDDDFVEEVTDDF